MADRRFMKFPPDFLDVRAFVKPLRFEREMIAADPFPGKLLKFSWQRPALR